MKYYYFHHSARSLKIDILRGIAVIGMIIAHALFFFHDKSNSTLVFLEKILNTTVFTIFVFVFGQSLSKWLDKHSKAYFRTILILSLKRSLIFYLSYIVVAITAVATTSPRLSSIVSALILTSPPNFTEYFLFFIILVLAVPILRPLLRLTRSSVILTLLIGAFFYLLGITLYEFHVPEFLTGIKAIFAGDKMLLRFPILFYLPVVLCGLWWQHDIDHNKQNNLHKTKHLFLLFAVVLLTTLGVILNYFINIPILSLSVRWPPSITFLAMGISCAIIGYYFIPSFAWLGNAARHAVAYFGRYALDIWVSHLLLLFLYRQFVSVKFNNVVITVSLIFLLFVLILFVSSIIITHQVRFPHHMSFAKTRRFSKRFAIYAFAGLIFMLLSLSPPSSPYGSFLKVPTSTAKQELPPHVNAKLATTSSWYVKHSTHEQIELILSVEDGGKLLNINPEIVQIYMNSQVVDFSGVSKPDGTIHFTKAIDDITPGTYAFEAQIQNGGISIKTNSITVNVTEPLLVAWTFDWEGWDVSNEALNRITDLTAQYPTLKFTHFINPRTFLPSVLTPKRQAEVISYLNERHKKGDELAMHLHMHYDLVVASGVVPKKTNAWGLRTEEGYDIPTTEYTKEEFRKIVKYAQNLTSERGLPPMVGYRAGGWYLNTSLLNELRSLGYEYDSSGRDKPKIGPFRNTPWDLPVGSQPYFSSITDQNQSAINSENILEIPNNGLSTFDQTVEMLQSRINVVYKGGVLSTPKVLVFVSHPQFYTQEFSKIPQVLNEANSISQVADRGPAIFVTMSDILEIWHSLNK